MPHHVSIRLPDGRTACADYRDPIVKTMRRVNMRIVEASPGAPAGDPGDYQLVAAWLDDHAEQSQLCRSGLAPDGPDCGHD